MEATHRQQATELLAAYGQEGGHPPAVRDQLVSLLYDDLRRLAGSYLVGEGARTEISATDLVHETYGRLIDQRQADWKSRSHFFAIAAHTMRRVLIDLARRSRRAKRGGAWQRVTLDAVAQGLTPDALDIEDLLALDAALTRLEALDPRQAQVVELRFFAGMSVPEVAEALGVSPRSVDRDWNHARSWLRRELSR